MSQELAPIPAPIVVRTPEVEHLRPVQRRALQALLEHPTLVEAARAVGKSRRTLYRWMRDPVFRRCVEELLASREASLEIQALHAAGTAFSVLSHIAGERYETRIRVSAARHILEYADRQIARRRDS